MDTTELQARVQQLNHLVPSQKEWLERLLFQLAFNDSDQIYIVGGLGSGKSTLVMAIAELCSEHYNIALLSSNIGEAQVSDQLMQQWFGKPVQPDIPLETQLQAELSQLPLLLIVDDAERYTKALTEQLNSLPCQQFYFSIQSPTLSGLTLTLNRITELDAEHLLKHEGLNSIELNERLAQAGGNIRLLLLPSERHHELVAGTVGTVSKKLVYGVAALFVVLVLVYVFWPANTKIPKSKIQPVNQQSQQVIQKPITEQTISEPHTTPDMLATDKEPIATPSLQTEESLDAVVGESQNVTDANVAEQEVATLKAIETETNTDSLSDTSDQVADEHTSDAAANIDAVAEQQYLHDETQLLRLAKGQVAVQLAVLSSEAALQRFKRTYPQLATLSYQRNWQGKMQLVLLLAPFDDAQSAKAQMKQLPEALRATGPFVKALQAVQAEIRARPLSQQNSNPE
jgi:DamX protein